MDQINATFELKKQKQQQQYIFTIHCFMDRIKSSDKVL